MAGSSQPWRTQLFPAGQIYVQHLHQACLHPYLGIECDFLKLNAAVSSGEQDEPELYILHVAHPRWCPECVEARSRSILEGYEGRLKQASSERELKHRAYIRGVRDGRVQALSRPLRESEALTLQEMLETLRLESDEAVEETESRREEEQRYLLGVAEGRKIQAMIERNAIDEQDPRWRREKLARAIL
jgi:hypothetical protein